MPDEALSKNKPKPTWREMARNIQIPERELYPVIPDFEKSVMTSMRVTGTQLVCSICPHCKRPLIQSLYEEHKLECQKEIKLKQEESATSTTKSASANTNTTNTSSSSSSTNAASSAAAASHDSTEVSKRKNADPETEVESKKQKTEKKKVKQSKPPKLPRQSKQSKPAKEKPVVVYNPDKNCGSILPNGQPCMRSLTCKQHSMGAKRAVAGRSAPYDVLLSNYHRQHQVRQAQLSVSAAQAAQLESDQEQELRAQKNPEKEVRQVLEGVSRATCQPLARKTILESRTRVKSFRMREMFAVALLPRRVAVTGDVLYARSLGFRPDAPDDLTGIRAPAVQQAFMMARIQQQRQQQMRQQMLQQQQMNAKMKDPANQNPPNKN